MAVPTKPVAGVTRGAIADLDAMNYRQGDRNSDHQMRRKAN
jgi:hypothetical protein